MIVQNEFAIALDVVAAEKNLGKLIEYYEEKGAYNLGQHILRLIPYEEVPDESGKRFRIQLMVFPRKEWELFVDKVRMYNPSFDIRRLLNELDETMQQNKEKSNL